MTMMRKATRSALIFLSLCLLAPSSAVPAEKSGGGPEEKRRQTNDIAVTIVVSGLSCTCARFAEDIRNVVNDLRPDGLRVLPVIGVGGLHRLNPNLRQRFEHYVAAKGLRLDDLKVKGQFLPAGDIRAMPGRGNILLCGDAAGAVDPISGEGIPFALWTGAAAGRAVAAALAQGADPLTLYRRDYDVIVAPLLRARRWRWLIYPRYVQPVFAWALGFGRVRDFVFTERRQRRRVSAAATPRSRSQQASP